METLDKLSDLKVMWKSRATEAEKKVVDLEKVNKGFQQEIQRLNGKDKKGLKGVK